MEEANTIRDDELRSMIINEYEEKDNRVKLLNDNLGNLGFVRNLKN